MNSMGFKRFIVTMTSAAVLMGSHSLLAENAPSNSTSNISTGKILYLMRSGNADRSFELYKQHYQESGQHDFELLHQMILLLLDQGYRSPDPEIQLLTLFGAGISMNDRLLYILEAGLDSHIPQLQLISLSFLARFQNDRADQAMNRAMSSNFLPIRLEATFYLAQKKYPTAVGQTEALMHKIDNKLWFVFPQLFAMIGDPSSIKILRRLMNDPVDATRIESILSAAKYERDDLLPQIRNLATHLNIGQQEACATALGIMKDDTSICRLQTLAQSTSSNVQVAAWSSLYILGKKEVKEDLMSLAREGDLFAIVSLGNIEGTEDLLAELTKNKNINIRINASLALLERQDPRCLISLCEILIRDGRDLGYVKQQSVGHSLAFWKPTPSAQQNFQENPYLYELSVGMREAALNKAVDLPERDFLLLANTLFEVQQNDLIPTLVHLLENMRSPIAIEMLKRQQQKIGAPLIRNYCNLALYRLKEEGPYGGNLRQWIIKQHKTDMIQFRPLLPWEMRQEETRHELTAKETSQLLIESVEALAQAQDNVSIEALLDAIHIGNSKNKYALAGLLIRAIQ